MGGRLAGWGALAYIEMMSRAFTKEQDDAPTDLGERPVSPHRNLVTPAGLKMIEDEIARLQRELADANVAGERSAVARISRDLRYWTARRENAELSVPAADSDVVRFGMTVELENLNEARSVAGPSWARTRPTRQTARSPMSRLSPSCCSASRSVMS